MARHSRIAPYARPVALVAFLGQPLVADQRHRLLRPAVLHRPMAQVGAVDLGGISGRAVDSDPVCLAELSRRRGLDPLQRPPAAHLLHHRLRRGAHLDFHRANAKPGNLQCTQVVRQGVQSAGDALGSLHLVRLVRRLHPGAWRHGVRHRHSAEHQPHVRRRRQRGMDGLSLVSPRHGHPGCRVACRLALYHPVRPSRAAHGRSS